MRPGIAVALLALAAASPLGRGKSVRVAAASAWGRASRGARFLCFVGFVAASVGIAGASNSGSHEQIVFARVLGGSASIYTTSPTGDSVTVVVALPHENLYYPDLSRSGKRLLFASAKRIFVSAADGSHAHILTAGSSPSWSPDGAHLVFVRGRDLYTASAAGTGVRRILHDGARNFAPSWGSSGLIAYESDVGGSFDIYVMDPRGSQIKRVTFSADGDFDPAWSPRGDQIAYDTAPQAAACCARLAVATRDSAGRWRTRLYGLGEQPTWSPDGRRIAFAYVAHGTGDSGIFVMNADGTGRHRITENPSGDFYPAWAA